MSALTGDKIVNSDNLFDIGGKKFLEKKGYKVFGLLDFPGH